MKRRGLVIAALATVTAVGAGLGWQMRSPAAPSDAEMSARYALPLTAPDGPIAVYHFGHSLVNRDMPAMLAQLAGVGHRYESQLGWGATLQSHWGDAPVNGFDEENAHDQFRPAREAVASGDYDAIVLTEMVEIKDALAYFDSPRYLSLWAREALAARPDVRVYLYETWHPYNDPEGWLERLDRDLGLYWEGGLLRPALATLDPDQRIFLIPAGQVLAAFTRTVEAQGGVGNIRDRTDLFARGQNGEPDYIHLNDLGNYLVALTHYAVLYQKSPVGLPLALNRADGSPADTPAPDTALIMQQIAWNVAQSTPLTGLTP